MDFKELGFTKQEVMDKVVDNVTKALLSGTGYDADMEVEVEVPTQFKRDLQATVEKKVDKAVEKVANKYVDAGLKKLIEDFVLQKTSQYGEKQGKPVTFVEYLIFRAEFYMQEEVDYEGKTKSQSTSSYWRPHGTRIEYMIGRDLQFHIKTFAENALRDANSAIVGGMEKAVKIKLAEIQKNIQLSLKQ